MSGAWTRGRMGSSEWRMENPLFAIFCSIRHSPFAIRHPGSSQVKSGSLPSGADGQFLVDLLDRLAPGLQAEEIIHRPGHQEPAAEIDKSQRNLRQGHVGFEVVAGAHDQGKAYRTDDLADAAEAIGRAHARGSQV